VKAGLALAGVAWLLVIAWLVLWLTDHESAAGWSLVAAGVLLLMSGPIFRRADDPQVRVTGVTMLIAGVFFAGLGLVFAL
jgi:hypothetical protein